MSPLSTRVHPTADNHAPMAHPAADLTIGLASAGGTKALSLIDRIDADLSITVHRDDRRP
jgi:hypothetical protein